MFSGTIRAAPQTADITLEYSSKDRMEALIRVQQAATEAGPDLDAVMEAIVNELGVMPNTSGIIVELRDGENMRYAAASGTSRDHVGTTIPIATSLSGMCVLSATPLSCVDTETDPRVARETCRRLAIRSMILAPIPHRGKVVGAIKFYSDIPNAFDAEDILTAQLLVGPLVVGLSGVAAEEDRQVGLLKDEFISTVSHELRTPLTSIKGSLGLALSGALGELSPKLAKVLEIAQRNSERLVRLVNDLLDMDKLQSGKMEFDFSNTNVGQLLIDAKEQTAPMADQHGSPIEVSLPQEALIAVADAHRLQQVLTNLISNAAKFSPNGAPIRLSATATPESIRISVSDDGPGISAEFRLRLFERFAQADPLGATSNAPGTGLGLAITKHIIEAHGGRIYLDPATTSGATFHIDLPRRTVMA